MRLDIHAYLQVENNNLKLDEMMLDMEENNIDQRVFTLEDDNDNYYEIINKTVSIVKNSKGKLIGCLYINPKIKNIIEYLNYAVKFDEIKFLEMNGIKDSYYPDIQENIDEIFQIAEENSLPIKVFSGIGMYGLPHQWLNRAKKYKSLKLIFLHIGCFDYGYSCVDIVKDNRNYYVETSNQYEMQILKKAFNSINEKNIVFGTMYPYRFSSNGIDIFNLFNIDINKLNRIFYKNSMDLMR